MKIVALIQADDKIRFTVRIKITNTKPGFKNVYVSLLKINRRKNLIGSVTYQNPDRGGHYKVDIIIVIKVCRFNRINICADYFSTHTPEAAVSQIFQNMEFTPG